MVPRSATVVVGTGALALMCRDDLVTPPTVDPVELAFVRDDFLRVTNGSVEDDFISRAIRAATRMAERRTQRALMYQVREAVFDYRFPSVIVLGHPPVIAVLSIEYVDVDGAVAELDPSAYEVSRPKGPYAARATVRPAYGLTWPATRTQVDAVTVTYSAGFLDESQSPAVANVPEDIVQGILLTVGEMYKVRSESVHVSNQTPALLRARELWDGYRVY